MRGGNFISLVCGLWRSHVLPAQALLRSWVWVAIQQLEREDEILVIWMRVFLGDGRLGGCGISGCRGQIGFPPKPAAAP
jgi:hypothetical protein